MGKIIDFNSFRNANIQEEALEGFLKSIEEKESDPEFQAVVSYRKDKLVKEMIKRCYSEDIVNAYFDYVDMMDADYTGEDEKDYLSLNTVLKIFDIEINDIADDFEIALDYADLIEDVYNKSNLVEYFKVNKEYIWNRRSFTIKEWEEFFAHLYTKHGLLVIFPRGQ